MTSTFSETTLSMANLRCRFSAVLDVPSRPHALYRITNGLIFLDAAYLICVNLPAIRVDVTDFKPVHNRLLATIESIQS